MPDTEDLIIYAPKPFITFGQPHSWLSYTHVHDWRQQRTTWLQSVKHSSECTAVLEFRVYNVWSSGTLIVECTQQIEAQKWVKMTATGRFRILVKTCGSWTHNKKVTTKL